jgi:hypothetical protein
MKSDDGKMDVQFVADEEDQDGAQRGQNKAGGMIAIVCRARKHVGNAAAIGSPMSSSKALSLAEIVTYVLGTLCHPCVRAGP